MLRKNLERAFQKRKKDGSTPFEHLVFTFELVPARASKGKALDEIIAFSKEAAKSKKICALSITDNAGGHPALTPRALGVEIKALGIEPIIHFSCKDKNRNLIESELFELDRNGLNTLLVLTGDYPRYGYKGRAKPVFDLDSVLVLMMIEEIKRGLVIHSKAPGGGIKLPPMNFFAGCVVSPFKRTEAEQVQQYLKLKRKIKAGARFVITQMGYCIRKYHELRQLLDLLDLKVPLVGTVLIPDKRLSRIIYRGIIPGCTMPKRLLERIEACSDEEDKIKRLERAAKLVALLGGIGYQGIHLSGPGLKYEDIQRVIELSKEYSKSWKDFLEEFYFEEEWSFFLFEKEKDTPLNSKEIKKKKSSRTSLSLSLLFGRAIHRAFFEPGKGLFNMAQKIAAYFERTGRASGFSAFEYFIKEFLYDCKRCGDCYLGELDFLCPQSQCAKKLINGPCGGSEDGWCEVWGKKKRCLFVRQYNRKRNSLDELFKDVDILPPRDWGLELQSSWINFFLGRDHHHLKADPKEDK